MMADTPASAHPSDPTTAPAGDLSALAWVHDELRRTLEAAQKALRRALRDQQARPEGVAADGQPVLLVQARGLVHQAVGVLEMIGLPAAARCLHGSEQALLSLAQDPSRFDAAALATLERGSFAMLDFLRRTLAGQPISPLSLFPSYRAVLALAGVQRVHPADLCPAARPSPAQAMDWTPTAPARASGPATNAAVERALLDLLRSQGEPAPLRRLSELFAGLATGARGPAAETWHLASAFFEAQATGALPADEFTRRMPSRLLAQLKAVERGQAAGSDRLNQDLRFFCSRARVAAESPMPRLAQVRQRLDLPDLAQVDYERSPLGRLDPAQLPLARRRAAAFRETWSAVSAGDTMLQPLVPEQLSLVAESVRQLYPDGDRLATALQAAASASGTEDGVPRPDVAMEVATALLCVDASLDEMDLDRPELSARVNRLAERLNQVAAGAAPDPVEPWMEALYRDVSDRQTMGSVVQELRASLAEIEQQLDRFHRHPGERELLIPVPGQLAAMRGVLSVLGLDQASQAVLRMRDDVDAMMQPGGLSVAGESRPNVSTAAARLADNLGGLSFLIDMLGVQPALAKALFRFDPASGTFSALMGRATTAEPVAGAGVEASLKAQLATVAEAALATATPHDELARSLEGLAQQAVASDAPALADAATRARSALAAAQDDADRLQARAGIARTMADAAAPAAAVAASPPPSEAADEDLREIFLEEAREVLAQAGDAVQALAEQPRDLGAMTGLRRAFHTLKGSARMVGLTAIGEAGWACEQLFNTRLAEAVVSADEPLRLFTQRALVALGEGVEALAADPAAPWTAEALVAEAQALREGRQDRPAGQAQARQPPVLTGGMAAEPLAADPVPMPVVAVPAASVASSAAHADDDDTLPQVPPVSELPVEAPAQPTGGWPIDLDLDLDLGGEAEAGEAPALDAEAWAATVQGGLDQAGGPPPTPEVDFELDLGALDEAPAQPLSLAPAAPADAEASGEPSGSDSAVSLSGGQPVREDATVAATDEPDPAIEAITAETAPPEPAGAERAEPVAAEPEPSEPVLEAAAPPAASVSEIGDIERFKVVGPLRIPIGLFNVFLNEADEQSRRLGVELAEWSLERDRPVGESAVALAHSLAGNSATVGYQDLSALSRRLEHALERAHGRGEGSEGEAVLFVDAAEEIRRLLHQFAAGFLRPVPAELLDRFDAHESAENASSRTHGEHPTEADERTFAAAPPPPAVEPVQALPLGVVRFAPLPEANNLDREADAARATSASAGGLGAIVDDLDAEDAPDPGLWPIFAEEAQDLLPALAQHLRRWEAAPADRSSAVAAMRSLHTFKGGARLAGAMGLGELAHRLESAIEQVLAGGPAEADVLAQLHGGVDRLTESFHRLDGDAPASPPAPADAAVADWRDLPDRPATPMAAADAPAVDEVSASPVPSPAGPLPPRTPVTDLPVDWQPFLADAASQAAAIGPGPTHADTSPVSGSVRVRVPLLDRMVSHAGEVGAARARIDSELTQMRTSMKELTENLDRLRRQLRDLELQAETQMSSRLEAARAAQQVFDPLEMDRFTRVQELTRMLAESVNDVGTVQRGLQQAIQVTEDQLAWQARLTRDLQDDLLRARMVEFDTLSERLYRVVRQAAKETGKQVRLNLEGGTIEIDRGVLDRMAPAFEHLLRNAVVHGVEPASLREALGKDPVGSIDLRLKQLGNEVQIEVRDDGAGLDLVRIAERARASGLLTADARPTEADLAGMIFQPGFSTVEDVTELAGRGIGMDIVRAEVTSLGGRVDTASASGRGTAFNLVLPLTTAVTQVVVLSAGGRVVAVPATLVERVLRSPVADVRAAYVAGQLQVADDLLPFFWLGGLLGQDGPGQLPGRTATVLVARSASQRVVLHVDQVVGNQDVVVKNLGPQLSRLPALSGLSTLPDGHTVLIYNPVALAAIYGDEARDRLHRLPVATPPAGDDGDDVAAGRSSAALAPLVLVVDDSLTVRRVTQRLLLREGFRVQLAKDGLEALERLAAERPAVVLCDIEMPRMDGFDLLRNLRGEARLQDLPVVMITSRIAERHRDLAMQLGANDYLGKPYDEQMLLKLVRELVAQTAA